MNIASIGSVIVTLMVLSTSGCVLDDEEQEKLKDAQVDLEQLADQIITTPPENSSTVTDPEASEEAPSDDDSTADGEFTKHFGGTKDDRARHIVQARDGGYIVLGSTKSSEVSGSVDLQGDDWIFKLNDQGEVEWEYVSNAGGRSRFDDIEELADGSIVSVGHDWNSDNAVALKLDENGEQAWEVTYRPDAVSQRYDFVNVVEFNGTIYASSAEWGAGGCDGCTKRVDYYLHTISSDNGNVSDPLDVPGIAGIRLSSVSELMRTRSGNLLLSGYAMPEEADPDDYSAGGAYLQVLGADLSPSMVWNNVGSQMYDKVGDAVELSNGKFAVIGQGQMAGEVAISVIDGNGAEFSHYIGDSNLEYYGGESIAAGSDGSLYALVFNQASSPSQLALLKFYSNLNIERQSNYLSFDGDRDPSGLLRNEDGMLTLLFSESPSNSSDYDIVVKTLMDDL